MSDTKSSSPYVNGGGFETPPQKIIYGIAILVIIVIAYYYYTTYYSVPAGTKSSFSMRDKFETLKTRQQALLNKLKS